MWRAANGRGVWQAAACGKPLRVASHCVCAAIACAEPLPVTRRPALQRLQYSHATLRFLALVTSLDVGKRNP
jgi:hypothetical protein